MGISEKERVLTAWREKCLKGNLKHSLSEKIVGTIVS
jgi:hypothetical protein